MYFTYFIQINKYNYLFHLYFTYINISFKKKICQYVQKISIILKIVSGIIIFVIPNHTILF